MSGLRFNFRSNVFCENKDLSSPQLEELIFSTSKGLLHLSPAGTSEWVNRTGKYGGNWTNIQFRLEDFEGNVISDWSEDDITLYSVLHENPHLTAFRINADDLLEHGYDAKFIPQAKDFDIRVGIAVESKNIDADILFQETKLVTAQELDLKEVLIKQIDSDLIKRFIGTGFQKPTERLCDKIENLGNSILLDTGHTWDHQNIILKFTMTDDGIYRTLSANGKELERLDISIMHDTLGKLESLVLYAREDNFKAEPVQKALDLSNNADFLDISAEHMTELLTDPHWSTWKMFQDLASDYLNGSEEVKKGIDTACAALTGWNFSTIAQQVIDIYEETQKEEDLES